MGEYFGERTKRQKCERTQNSHWFSKSFPGFLLAERNEVCAQIPEASPLPRLLTRTKLAIFQ